MSEALGRRAARGAVVAVGGQVLRVGVGVLSVVLLARLLSPHDYGLLAMVMAVVGVVDVFRDLGLSTAAVQARTLSAAQRTNLFWLNTGLGVVLAAVVFALAPLVAAVYGQPELVDITRALAGVLVLNGLATQYRADLTRQLRFARLAVADVVSPLAGLAAGVALAVAGAGYWALVGQQLVQYAVMMPLVVRAGGWRPGRPDRRVPMDGMVRFGRGVMGVHLMGYAGRNIDTLTLGTRFGPEALGLYNRGFQLLMSPLGQLRTPATQVALPVLASLQDDDARFGAYVRRGQLALGLTLVAGLGLVAGTAGPVTAVLLGDRWTAVEPLLRLLAVGGIFQTLNFVGYWVYLSRGLAAQLVRFTAAEIALRLACVLVGSLWGVTGVAAGYALAWALIWPLSLWWLGRRVALPVRALVLGAGRVLAVATVVGAASWAATLLVTGPGPALALGVAAGAVSYALVAGLVPALRRDLRDVVEVARLARQR